MAGPAVEYTYRYGFASEALTTSAGMDLRLATSGPDDKEAEYFRGKLTRPKRAADLLRGLVEVVQSRFFIPPAMLARILALADPVVTCGDDVLRFEAFSACCGVYARADFLPPALDGERTGRGTTNVDFNAPMRAALARVRDSDNVGLAVGACAVELSRGGDAVVERKVALPLRWLKGFVEVQAYQSRMARRLEVPGPEAVRFLRALLRSAGPGAAWVVPAGRGLVGFDLAEGAYFHRELPFDLKLVESLHPRLSDARKLVAGGGVRVVRRDGARVEAMVPGTNVEHRVVLSGDTAICTCPWYAKHQGERGPCKHVLAVQIVLDEEVTP